MKKTLFLIAISFVTLVYLPSCSQPPKPHDLSKASLPQGVRLLENSSITSVGDLDGDGAQDRFAFAHKAEEDIGFVVGLTSTGKYMYCEWQEMVNGSRSETSFSFKPLGKDIQMELKSQYEQSELTISYSEQQRSMVFKHHQWHYYTNDGYDVGKGEVKWSGNVYICKRNGKTTNIPNAPLPLTEKSPFFTFGQD